MPMFTVLIHVDVHPCWCSCLYVSNYPLLESTIVYLPISVADTGVVCLLLSDGLSPAEWRCLLLCSGLSIAGYQ